MIDRQRGLLIFECDTCGEVLDTGEDEWGMAHAEFRNEGWRSEKEDGDWTHLCPKCA